MSNQAGVKRRRTTAAFGSVGRLDARVEGAQPGVPEGVAQPRSERRAGLPGLGVQSRMRGERGGAPAGGGQPLEVAPGQLLAPPQAGLVAGVVGALGQLGKARLAQRQYLVLLPV